jgi:hypothetical protein
LDTLSLMVITSVLCVQKKGKHNLYTYKNPQHVRKNMNIGEGLQRFSKYFLRSDKLLGHYPPFKVSEIILWTAVLTINIQHRRVKRHTKRLQKLVDLLISRPQDD